MSKEKFGVHSIAEMWKVIPEYPYQGSYATDAAIATKRDAIVRVLAAYAKLYRFMMSNESKQAYIDAYLAAAGQNRKQAEDLWRFNSEQVLCREPAGPGCRPRISAEPQPEAGNTAQAACHG